MFKIIFSSFLLVMFIASSAFADFKCTEQIDGSTKCMEIDKYGFKTNKGIKCKEDNLGTTTCKELDRYGMPTSRGMKCRTDVLGSTVCKETDRNGF
jgi:hypothetical protein